MTASPNPENAGSQPPGSAPPLRASDAEREACVRVLHDAAARGLLSIDECDERMHAAYAARFRADLPPLTADLPPATEQPAAPGWRQLGTMAAQQVRTSLMTGLSSPTRWGLVAAVLLLALLVVGLAGVAVHELFEFEPDFEGSPRFR